MTSQRGKSSTMMSGPPATISAEERDAMQIQVADYALRYGLDEEETLDLLGMFGVLKDEMLSTTDRERRRVA